MDTAIAQPSDPKLVKISVCLEQDDFHYVTQRGAELYGRRGVSMYIRKLILADRNRVPDAPMPYATSGYAQVMPPYTITGLSMAGQGSAEQPSADCPDNS